MGILSLFLLVVHFDFADAASSAKSLATSKSTIVKVTTKKVTKVTKPKGTWHVVATYNGPGPDGPFIPNTVNYDDLELTFKGNSYCRSDYASFVDDTKPFCEPITFKKDGTFTGGRLEAWGGFMKMNGSKLEFFEGGKGYTKYVLEKKK